MLVNKREFSTRIAELPEEMLEEITKECNISAYGNNRANAIANAIWRRASSPVQRVLQEKNLHDIVFETAECLDIDIGQSTGWQSLTALTVY